MARLSYNLSKQHCLFFLIAALIFMLIVFSLQLPDHQLFSKLKDKSRNYTYALKDAFVNGDFKTWLQSFDYHPNLTQIDVENSWQELLDSEKDSTIIKTAITSPSTTANFSSLTPTNATTKASSPKQAHKIILLWTKWFGDSQWRDILRRLPTAPFVDDGSGNNSRRCLLVNNRNSLTKADAVVFHGRDFSFKDSPTKYLPNRLPLSWQKWVFLLLESPANSGLGGRWKEVNKFGFNWLMSYSQQADVYYPYGVLYANKDNSLAEEIDKKIDGFVNSFHRRPKDAVWLVSNCHTASRRESVVKGLKKAGISVDIWGGCGPRRPASEMKKIGGKAFFERYKFYLSFENSICTDYASEKFYLGLNASQHFGVIPVVYGGANYAVLAPKEAYIDALNFSTVEELGEYMKNLSSPKSGNLRSFFQWHHKFRSSSNPMIRVNNGWQTLCRRLWESGGDSNIGYLKNIDTLIGSCKSLRLQGYLSIIDQQKNTTGTTDGIHNNTVTDIIIRNTTISG